MRPVTTLLLVRHGETDWNREGRWQGHSDTHLNEVGREQAARLAAEVDGVDAIYSSDLARARETAGDKNISVMGADTGRQFIDAGVIDEISIHIVPVLFGSGTPLFGKGVSEHITLEFVGASETEHARHARYRVVRDG